MSIRLHLCHAATADAKFAAYQALCLREAQEPALTENPEWVADRQRAYREFEASFREVRL